MNRTNLSKHLQEIMALPAQERAVIMSKIWESLESDFSKKNTLTKDQMAELSELEDEFESGQMKIIPWDSIKAK